MTVHGRPCVLRIVGICTALLMIGFGASLGAAAKDTNVKLVDSHVANGHETIEWVFGGTDVGVWKTPKK